MNPPPVLPYRTPRAPERQVKRDGDADYVIGCLGLSLMALFCSLSRGWAAIAACAVSIVGAWIIGGLGTRRCANSIACVLALILSFAAAVIAGCLIVTSPLNWRY